jgi:hypothetical protein
MYYVLSPQLIEHMALANVASGALAKCCDFQKLKPLLDFFEHLLKICDETPGSTNSLRTFFSDFVGATEKIFSSTAQETRREEARRLVSSGDPSLVSNLMKKDSNLAKSFIEFFDESSEEFNFESLFSAAKRAHRTVDNDAKNLNLSVLNLRYFILRDVFGVKDFEEYKHSDEISAGSLPTLASKFKTSLMRMPEQNRNEIISTINGVILAWESSLEKLADQA